jgi:hypothetical protein
MMMFGIDEEVARLFVKDAERFPTDPDVTRASGIDTLLPGSQIQEFCFEPCGYSMNGLLYDAYWTIHITPESHCSYASFETNIRMTNYASLVKAVLAIFRPKRFTMTLFADEHGLRQLKETPFQPLVSVPVVESTARAIMGPCMMLADGNIAIVTPAAAAGGSSTPTAGDQQGQGQRAGNGQPEAEGQQALARGASTGGANAEAGTGSSSSPLAISVAGGGSEGVAGASTPVSVTTPAAAAAAGPTSPNATGAGAVVAPGTAGGVSARAMARVGSSAALAGGSRKGAVSSYVATAKCNTEFMGYCCFLGNYKMVHSATSGSTRGGGMTGVADAAKEQLSMPRAKYVVAQKVEQMMAGRVRTESF